MADNYLPNTTEYAISPYSSYASDIMNKLTRVSTLTHNCVLGAGDSLEVEIDPGGLTLTINPGKCVIDDTYIELTESVEVDLVDIDNFVNNETILTETGNYYICLYYRYLKTRTLPQAAIKIFHPSIRDQYTPDGYYLLLKVVQSTNPGGGNIATSCSNFDDEGGYETNYKTYKRNYAEYYNTLPEFSDEYIGRFAAVFENGLFALYVGSDVEWILLSGEQDENTYSIVVEKAANPSILDDEYVVGTIWINNVNDSVWICAHQENDASIWIQCVTPSGSYVDAISSNRDPINTDSSYSIPALWTNTVSGDVFVCIDNTIGASIWLEVQTSPALIPDVTEILRSRFLL